MEVDMPGVPFVIVAATLIIVLYTSSRRHRERMEMLRRGMSPSIISAVHVSKPGNKSLLAGLLCCAEGIALLSAMFLSDYDQGGLFISGWLCFFTGGALLLYWKFTAKHREYRRRLHEECFAKSAAPDKGNSAETN